MKTPKKKILTIYDTTLRDGAQTAGISFSLADKLRIASALDRAKIDYIEGGWPGSNPKDDMFFKEIKEAGFSHSRIAAFGSTRRKNLSIDEDNFFQALLNSRADLITLVAKSWDFHVTDTLNIDLEHNLRLIRESIEPLKDAGYKVFLDAEHFFDGYKENSDYALRVLDAASAAGADMLVLCDTNGGILPHEAFDIVSDTIKSTRIPVGVHFHNDSGMAEANSQYSVLAGAVSVQGTINGYGERCGNCNLITLIPNLTLKMGYDCAAGEKIGYITELSRFVSETANLAHNDRAPYVGENSFAHKGGIHASAVQKDARTYEHIDPAIVGNERKILISELSGKSNVELRAKELDIEIPSEPDIFSKIVSRVKALEDRGFQFEAADGSFELLIVRASETFRPFFRLKGFRVITEMNSETMVDCEATIKLEVNGIIEHTAANGNGPVDALDRALRKSLVKFYPEIEDIHLTDYKVRVLDEKEGTGSSVRVLIDQKSEHHHWGTVGVSQNIIEASWQALVDGIEYLLYKKRKK